MSLTCSSGMVVWSPARSLQAFSSNKEHHLARWPNPSEPKVFDQHSDIRLVFCSKQNKPPSAHNVIFNIEVKVEPNHARSTINQDIVVIMPIRMECILINHSKTAALDMGGTYG